MWHRDIQYLPAVSSLAIPPFPGLPARTGSPLPGPPPPTTTSTAAAQGDAGGTIPYQSFWPGVGLANKNPFGGVVATLVTAVSEGKPTSLALCGPNKDLFNPGGRV